MPRNRKKSSLSARLDKARNTNVAAEEGATSKLGCKGVKTSQTITPQGEDLDKNIEGCICYRDTKTFICICCKMFSFGRITQPCPIHPNVTYLMDFACCPFCSGPAEHLHVVNMEYERYFT